MSRFVGRTFTVRHAPRGKAGRTSTLMQVSRVHPQGCDSYQVVSVDPADPWRGYVEIWHHTAVTKALEPQSETAVTGGEN